MDDHEVIIIIKIDSKVTLEMLEELGEAIDDFAEALTALDMKFEKSHAAAKDTGMSLFGRPIIETNLPTPGDVIFGPFEDLGKPQEGE